ncbi:MAG: PAS domain-containing protein [Spirochaetales bacterium]|nr:PAS domain-containing protein [Spirochaetales bacterium]
MRIRANTGAGKNWLSHVFDMSDQAIVIMERSDPYPVLDANKQFLELCGYKKRELIGKALPFQAVIDCLGEKQPNEKAPKYEYFTVPVPGSKEITIKAVFRDIPEDGIFIIYIEKIDSDRQELIRTLRHKEYLLRDMHCRIKNNMQIIVSLLHMQGLISGNSEFIDLMQANETRITLIGKIHELLYEAEDPQMIDLRQYFRILVHLLAETYKSEQNGIELKFDVDSIPLDIEHAIPLGLIANELISNALKYAYREQPGILELHAHIRDDGFLYLQIRDKGIGLPDFVDPEQPLSLGLQLVQSLSSQLEGNLFFSRINGTDVHFRMPYPFQYH